VIVLLSPACNQDISFFKGEKELTNQQLIAHLAIEWFNVTIFPGAVIIIDGGMEIQASVR
jgi:hypothetical protein